MTNFELRELIETVLEWHPNTYEAQAAIRLATALTDLQARVGELQEALRRVQDEANTVGPDWRDTASLIDSVCIAALKDTPDD